MRPIEFRGKRTDTGEWVYGVPYFLNIVEDEPEDCHIKACIITGVDWDGTCGFMSPENRAFVEVIPETVGQFTGLLDRNGKKIFEGDKLHRMMGVYWIVAFDKHQWRAISQSDSGLYFNANDFYEFEIIGTIHDTSTANLPGDDGTD
jgi:hypothetical protein